MGTSDDAAALLERLDLTEYEATALEELLTLGRTTAPNLSEATGIPKARIYGVLEELAEKGFVKVIPGRPKKYQSKAPETILERAEENYRQEFESRRREIEDMREEFLETFGPRFERASEDISPTEELFHVVDVGEPSERETRRLYRDAEKQVNVLTKSFAYLDAVEPPLADAIERGVSIRVLFLHPSHLEEHNRSVQADTIARLDDEYPTVETRFSNEKLPWRGTLVDPSMEYETGDAILHVEEKDVPLHMRQAAITENESFVAGLKRYFDLVWEYDSTESYPER